MLFVEYWAVGVAGIKSEIIIIFLLYGEDLLPV
jgi:hypothetical protein